MDWKLVERDVNKAKQQLKFHSSGNKMPPEVKSRVDEVRQLSQGVCRCLAAGIAENGIDSWALMGLPFCKYSRECLHDSKTGEVAKLCIFETARVASRHDINSPQVAANCLGLEENMLELWGEVFLQSDKKS